MRQNLRKKLQLYFTSHNKMRQEPSKTMKRIRNDAVWHSEGPHACAERRGSVGRRDGDVQIVPDLESLRLQGHGVVGALPAGHSAADVLEPERTDMFQYTLCTNSALNSAPGLSYQPVHLPSRVGVDYVKAEVGPLFSGLWVHFLHQTGQLLQGRIHPEESETKYYLDEKLPHELKTRVPRCDHGSHVLSLTMCRSAARWRERCHGQIHPLCGVDRCWWWILAAGGGRSAAETSIRHKSIK